MERTARTDERLDDLAKRMDDGFIRLEAKMDAGFERTDRGFGRVDADIRELREELRFELGGLRLTLLRIGGGIMAGLVGVIAAVLIGS
jgi:hypothetical protein